MPRVEVRRTYLELTRREQLAPARSEDPSLRLERLEPCPPPLYRYLYGAVGEAYHWVDRRDWSLERIAEHLASPDIAVYVLRRAGDLAGYFELRREGSSVEIAYLGLLPERKGRGLGKHLVTAAVEQAWAFGGERVWLHTCSLDDAAALPNYRRRGFRVFKEETYGVDLPEGNEPASQA